LSEALSVTFVDRDRSKAWDFDKASDKASDKGGLNRVPKMSKAQCHAAYLFSVVGATL